MRIRKLLAAGVLAAGLVVVLAAAGLRPGPGQEERQGARRCAVESALKDNQASIDKGNYRAFNNALDNCRKAKSLFTPAGLSEILWGLVCVPRRRVHR